MYLVILQKIKSNSALTTFFSWFIKRLSNCHEKALDTGQCCISRCITHQDVQLCNSQTGGTSTRNKTVIQSVIGCSGRLFIFQGQRVTSKAQTGCLERVQKEGSKLSRLIGPIRTKVKNVLLYPSIQEEGGGKKKLMIRSKQGINNRSLYFALFSLDI